MNALRAHISLLIPLITLLTSLQSIMLLQRATADKESMLVKSYSIMLVSRKPLDLKMLKSKISEVNRLDEIDPQEQLEKIQKNVSSVHISRRELPHFYSLGLEQFPDSKKLESIVETILSIDGVFRVESFDRSYSQLYSLLVFIKHSVVVFSLLTITVSVILVLKQIEIWKYAHYSKMEIMDILGASFWTKNGSLFKLSSIDSFIASIIVSVLNIYLSETVILRDLLKSIGVSVHIFEVWLDFFKLFFVAILVSFVSVVVVVMARVSR